MIPSVQDILALIETIAPMELAQPWDNVGLLIGRPDSKVNGLLIGLDPNNTLLDEAEESGVNTIITHHPVIFHPLKAVRTEQPEGQFIRRALRSDFNVIGCHTNFDSTNSGVSDYLIQGLGLDNCRPLADSTACPQDNSRICGLGRIGSYPEPITAAVFLSRLQKTISAPWLLSAGPKPKMISKVAVCGGSGSDLAETVHAAGADVYVTAEVKHATAGWAEATGLWIIDGGHFATENPAMKTLAQQIGTALTKKHKDIPIYVSKKQSSPLQLLDLDDL